MQTISVVGMFREGKTSQKVREEGFVPAVIYGKKTDPISVCVDKKVFGKIFSEAGESTIFHIETPDKKGYDVLVRDIQYHPLHGGMLHIDFYAVSMNEAVDTLVALEFVGESAAVKEDGGVLVTGLDEIEIRALPAKLPSSISVDISALKTFDDFIHVKDLSLPEGVEVLTSADTIVASVSRPRTEEEEDLSSQIDVTKVEVETKGKKEEVSE